MFMCAMCVCMCVLHVHVNVACVASHAHYGTYERESAESLRVCVCVWFVYNVC